VTPYLADAERFAAALAALGAGPARLRRFLEGYEPEAAWDALAAGDHRADPGRDYRAKASPTLVEEVDGACARVGAGVRVLARCGYPDALATDHQAPGVLFTLGDPSVLDSRPRVAIVGTRSATPYGLGVAADLGRGLSGAGIVVVSGLARGIDAAAHAGALAATDGAPPVAVMGTAFDAPAPRAHAQLRRAVADAGAVLSELAPGAGGAPSWWFAVRNRVMAALAHVVVVVECHHTGGSLHTVKAAVDRGVVVAAVPGSVRSAASAGCNGLLVDGAVPVRHVDDVLSAVELAISGHPDIRPPRRRPQGPSRPTARRRAPNPTAALVRRAVDHDPATLDTVVRRCGLAVGEVAVALEQLADAGLVTGDGGWWCRAR
jgi:DNA processing protein